MRKVIMGLLALLLALPAAVSASVWQGTVETAETSDVRAGAEGIVETLPLRVGEYVTAATEAAGIRESRVFAPFDGRISGIRILEGEEAAGQTVMTLEPVSPYDLYCSVKDAYKTVENTTVSGGQRVWIRCAADGSHRAVGRITTVDGLEFHAEILGGELAGLLALFNKLLDALLLGLGGLVPFRLAVGCEQRVGHGLEFLGSGSGCFFLRHTLSPYAFLFFIRRAVSRGSSLFRRRASSRIICM